MVDKVLIAIAQCVLRDELSISRYIVKTKKPQSNDIIVVRKELNSNYGEYLRPGERPSVEDYSALIYFNLINRTGKLILNTEPKKYSEYLEAISKQ